MATARESITVVPQVLGAGHDRFTVARAWPTTRVDARGRRSLAAEGPDDQGRLRAARVWLSPDAGCWRPEEVTVRPAGQDPKLPQLAGWARSGQVVVHRFGKRAVVATPQGYVKVVRPDASDRVADQAGVGRALARGADLDAPGVVSVGPGWVQTSVLPGESWHDWAAGADLEDWSRSWQHWAARWPAVVQQRPGVTHDRHDAVAEQANLRRWSDAVGAYAMLPEVMRAPFRERVDRACDALGDGAGHTLGVAHRDLHDKQVLWDQRRGKLGVLDFDTATMAEPALDLANLAVHVQLRVDQGLWPAGHARAAMEQIAAVCGALHVSPRRFEAYAEATRLRLACLYLFRPRYRSLALAWLPTGRPATLSRAATTSGSG